MGLIAKQTESNIEPIPPDTYHAVCYMVVDIGTHRNEIYDTEQRKTVIVWEIPSLTYEYEKNGEKKEGTRSISKYYTLSLNEKANLYKDLLSWRGVPFTPEELEGFDICKLVGVNCLLGIVNEKSRDGKRLISKIASISKLMKGMAVIKPEHDIITYSIQDDGINTIPEALPKWLQDEIKKSIEYQAVMHAKETFNKDYDRSDLANSNPDYDENYTQPDDEIPF